MVGGLYAITHKTEGLLKTKALYSKLENWSNEIRLASEAAEMDSVPPLFLIENIEQKFGGEDSASPLTDQNIHLLQLLRLMITSSNQCSILVAFSNVVSPIPWSVYSYFEQLATLIKSELCFWPIFAQCWKTLSVLDLCHYVVFLDGFKFILLAVCCTIFFNFS